MVVARVKPDGNCVSRFILCEDVVELIHVDFVINSHQYFGKMHYDHSGMLTPTPA